MRDRDRAAGTWSDHGASSRTATCATRDRADGGRDDGPEVRGQRVAVGSARPARTRPARRRGPAPAGRSRRTGAGGRRTSRGRRARGVPGIGAASVEVVTAAALAGRERGRADRRRRVALPDGVDGAEPCSRTGSRSGWAGSRPRTTRARTRWTACAAGPRSVWRRRSSPPRWCRAPGSARTTAARTPRTSVGSTTLRQRPSDDLLRHAAVDRDGPVVDARRSTGSGSSGSRRTRPRRRPRAAARSAAPAEPGDPAAGTAAVPSAACAAVRVGVRSSRSSPVVARRGRRGRSSWPGRRLVGAVRGDRAPRPARARSAAAAPTTTGSRLLDAVLLLDDVGHQAGHVVGRTGAQCEVDEPLGRLAGVPVLQDVADRRLGHHAARARRCTAGSGRRAAPCRSYDLGLDLDATVQRLQQQVALRVASWPPRR